MVETTQDLSFLLASSNPHVFPFQIQYYSCRWFHSVIALSTPSRKPQQVPNYAVGYNIAYGYLGYAVETLMGTSDGFYT